MYVYLFIFHFSFYVHMYTQTNSGEDHDLLVRICYKIEALEASLNRDVGWLHLAEAKTK